LDEVDLRLTPAQRAARKADLRMAGTLPLKKAMRALNQVDLQYKQLAGLSPSSPSESAESSSPSGPMKT